MGDARKGTRGDSQQGRVNAFDQVGTDRGVRRGRRAAHRQAQSLGDLRPGAARALAADRRGPRHLDGRRPEPQPRHRPSTRGTPSASPARSSPTSSCSSSALRRSRSSCRRWSGPGGWFSAATARFGWGTARRLDCLDAVRGAVAGDAAGYRHLAAADRLRRGDRRSPPPHSGILPRRDADRVCRRRPLRRLRCRRRLPRHPRLRLRRLRARSRQPRDIDAGESTRTNRLRRPRPSRRVVVASR